jgi:hypothetical protein
VNDDLFSAICREALESRQRDVMSFVDNGMSGMSARLEKTIFRLPDRPLPARSRPVQRRARQARLR